MFLLLPVVLLFLCPVGLRPVFLWRSFEERRTLKTKTGETLKT